MDVSYEGSKIYKVDNAEFNEIWSTGGIQYH